MSIEIKQKNEQWLEENGIPFLASLPYIDENECRIKSPEEIVKRAVTAFLTAQIAIDMGKGENGIKSAEFFYDILCKFGLENELTADEKIFFNLRNNKASDKKGLFSIFSNKTDSGISRQMIVNMAWRIEMCMPLFHACGFIENDLDYPNKPSDTMNLITIISDCRSFDDLMAKVKMCDDEKIFENADLIYRMDWACVDARIKGKNAPAELNGEVVVEQHKGYNWLISEYGAEDWDDVSADT